MNVSDRDRKILMAIIPLVVVLGYWFVLLSPKREAASVAAQTLTTEQARLAEAQATASTVKAAKASFARDYAEVVALGKAVPTSVDMPSLLVQLEQAAKGTGIELDGVTIGERSAATSAPAAGGAAPIPGAPSPAGTAAAGQAPQSAPGQAAASAQGAATAASTPPAAGDPAATGAPGAGTPAGAAPPATGGLESVAMEFDFKGNFFELADFFHRLKRFVYVSGDKVRVRGRLLTIDSVEYSAEPGSFPALAATVKASVYLTPKAEGPTAGATPAGPEAAAPAAAPVSTASSESGAPTPTAATTP